MTFTLDVSDDFVDVVDNHEAVTLRPPIDQNSNSELITNGRFDENLSGWSLGGAAWEDRLALCAADGEFLGQSITTAASGVYVASVDVFGAWSSTAPAVKVGTSLDGSQIETNTVSESGRLTFEFTASGTTTYLTLRNGDRRCRFGNVSVRLTGSTSITNALKRAVSNRDAAMSGGKYRAGDVRWHIAQDELTNPPAIGSVVIDGDGVEWTVLAVDEQTFTNRWRLWCRRLSVADDGLDSITIEKLLRSRSPSGAEQVIWQDWAINVAARIQREASSTTVQNDRRDLPDRVTVYTKYQFPVDHRFRVVGADGRTYKVQGYSMPDQIGGMFAINAEVNPWPLN